MNWHNSGKAPETEHDAVSSRRYKEDLDDLWPRIKELEATIVDLQKDADRFQWLSTGLRGYHIRDWINFHSPKPGKTLAEVIDNNIAFPPDGDRHQKVGAGDTPT